MHHLEGRKVRWASKDEGGGKQATSAEHGRREWARKKKANLDHLVLELMARVGCCGNLTALRGQPSTINTIPDINNNT